MTVIEARKDTTALNFTIVAEFEAGIKRVWQIWADPRQLERWWGPPTWPATFEDHEFQPGGKASYYMTGPEGGKARGWWRFTAIDAPHRLEFDDGFADENGDPVAEMGTTHAVVTLEDVGGRTRMTTVSSFESAEQLRKMLDMGMEEGMKEAMGQIDSVLASPGDGRRQED
ncbi:SRPBCC family protein [Arthrobacter mangrovi]|uniref:Activator of HSP90 ATPase n=1 Tax=Arthrobacter mangrovi TaxID=2966350 RepID=A0ABQ5MQ06_9MICC|nr:SRPBCC domain-containing protein [Arthrobacter mangrovi]GLB66073.1 activator of HSP90 ATPase [Arthrobacter mangrovi]